MLPTIGMPVTIATFVRNRRGGRRHRSAAAPQGTQDATHGSFGNPAQAGQSFQLFWSPRHRLSPSQRLRRNFEPGLGVPAGRVPNAWTPDMPDTRQSGARNQGATPTLDKLKSRIDLGEHPPAAEDRSRSGIGRRLIIAR